MIDTGGLANAKWAGDNVNGNGLSARTAHVATPTMEKEQGTVYEKPTINASYLHLFKGAFTELTRVSFLCMGGEPRSLRNGDNPTLAKA